MCDSNSRPFYHTSQLHLAAIVQKCRNPLHPKGTRTKELCLNSPQMIVCDSFPSFERGMCWLRRPCPPLLAGLSNWSASSERWFDQWISGIKFITRDGAPPQPPQINLIDKMGLFPFPLALLFLSLSPPPLTVLSAKWRNRMPRLWLTGDWQYPNGW